MGSFFIELFPISICIFNQTYNQTLWNQLKQFPNQFTTLL